MRSLLRIPKRRSSIRRVSDLTSTSYSAGGHLILGAKIKDHRKKVSPPRLEAFPCSFQAVGRLSDVNDENAA